MQNIFFTQLESFQIGNQPKTYTIHLTRRGCTLSQSIKISKEEALELINTMEFVGIECENRAHVDACGNTAKYEMWRNPATEEPEEDCFPKNRQSAYDRERKLW